MKRSIPFVVGAILVAVATVGVLAQNAITTDGAIESTSGGFIFPDGTVQTTAAAQTAAPVEDTGQQECWDVAGMLIDCSGTGQDGELQAGVDWPAPRFTDNGDGTVTDNLTGLIWLQEAECFSAIAWDLALAAANNLADAACGLTDGSIAGDWRLPNIKELLSLVDYGEFNPALPSAHPFTNVQRGGSPYWTSTTAVGGVADAWALNLNNGNDGLVNKTVIGFVWPLRGGA